MKHELTKGLTGFEESIAHGFCTHKSGIYLASKIREINLLPDEDYEELKYLFKLFERNIDKDIKERIV